MLVTAVKGDRLRVSVFSSANHELEDFGWVRVDSVIGWTLSRYDWDAFLRGTGQ